MVLGIYGAGGQGREILELAKQIDQKENRWEKYLFIDEKPLGKVNGVEVCSYDKAMDQYVGRLEITVAVGEPATREKLIRKVEKDGISIPTMIHPDVYIPDTTVVGKGVIVQYGCFVSCNVELGDYAFVQPGVNIGHNDRIDEGVMLAGMANLAGDVKIGRFTYVGLSAAVREGVSIGEYCIVGMYAAVHKDVFDEMVVMGNPARPTRKNVERRVFK